MTNQSATGLRRLAKALGYSMKGLGAAFANEEAIRLEVMALVVLAPVGIWLGDSGAERALLVGAPLIVLMAELLNSAIEAVVDRFGGERHELSGRAKDIGSATVLVACVLGVVTWGLILWPGQS